MTAFLIAAGAIAVGMIRLFGVGLAFVALLELADRYFLPRGRK